MKNVRGYFWHKYFNFLYILYVLYIKHKTFFSKKTYSEWGEDLFILKYFKNLDKGFYVDIGCYHPIKESQTAFLYKHEWRGVNLDISKQSIGMFKIFRSRDLNLNLGLSTKSGKQYAYFEGDISTVSSLDKNYLKKIGRKNKKKKSINVITLKKLRQKYKLKEINFLKLDCESMDESIIMQANLKDLDCNFLSIELLPQTHYGWKNYKLPKKNLNKYCREYFLKSKLYRKLKKSFIFFSNDEFSFLLKKIKK